jgi:Cu-Zn family superoxide dismutase
MMKIKTILLSSLAATMLFACGTEGEDQATTKGSDDDVKEEIKEDQKEVKKEENKLMVVMDAKSGSSAEGHINLEQKDNKVMMEVKMKGLAPGEHAIHIHENGDCSADDGTSAGGHWDPTGHDHGKWGEDAYHMGDIGNLIANDKGEVSFKFVTEKWCIGCEDKTMNIIGKSFIIHAGADDFKSQPSGAAGSRVACGVIEK